MLYKTRRICYNGNMRIFTYLHKRISKFFYRRKCKKLRLVFPLFCKVHGVKNADAQGAIAQSQAGDKLQLVHLPKENYPYNVYVYSIPLNRILGYLDERLSEKLVKLLGKGFCIDGAIENVTGAEYAVRGCNLRVFDTRVMMADVRDFTHLHGE